MNKAKCVRCNNEYPQSQMADWTICFQCKDEELKTMGFVYTDYLGIGWTQEDLDEIGGLEELKKLHNNSNL